MNGKKRETSRPIGRGPHHGVLVATADARERDSIKAWALSAGLKVSEQAVAGPIALDTGGQSADIQVVEWPHGTAVGDLIAALKRSGSRATLLIIPEDADVGLEASVMPDHWDFVRRPFDPRDLVWRAERALSRARRQTAVLSQARLACGPLSYDPSAGEIRVSGTPLDLRRAERDVLLYLMQNAQRFTSCEELQREVLHSHGSGGAARNQIYELRRKLRAAGLSGVIVSKGCAGYRLRWPV